ncbi:ATP-dependent endonuclease [Vampirovibrio sp.]|uniref:ATP-dependent nuclease n=1 Tax=Vampirovibrio sp. TaxID=2717857 RepID=UPI003593D967
MEYTPEILDPMVGSIDLQNALSEFAKSARRLTTADGDETNAVAKRTALTAWVQQSLDALKHINDLQTKTGIAAIKKIRDEANAKSDPDTADIVEQLLETVSETLKLAEDELITDQLYELIEPELPVLIYFENYGILDSAVYLPHFLDLLSRSPHDPKVRTVNAMFKHVGLTAKEIADLGTEQAASARLSGQTVTSEMIASDQERKERRAIKLNSGSLDITQRFNEWYGQRRHQIRYDADGDYFRIWIADDKRPGVEIELESRSKGFQWFFSFYLVFLVESEEGHLHSILLLDEPGLNLHPTAQQELIFFFERLSDTNPLIYSTHSPFLIDGEHIHRVRPVTEDESGHSHISNESTWPKDRETIFPLQAAAGYAMVKGLFQHKKNVLVEGMSDFMYLISLNMMCHAAGRRGLPDDVYITPCGGTKNVGNIASLFLGQNVRPIVLLDGDEAGRARRNALYKELYAGQESSILMLPDVLGKDDCEIEDILGEALILQELSSLLDNKVTLNKDDRTKGSLPDQIKAACERHSIVLPDGWKPEVARRLSIAWSLQTPKDYPEEVLTVAEKLFDAINQRFDSSTV